MYIYIIRKLEKINKRIVQSKNGIYFNEICLKEGLHPNFLIYIYINNPIYLKSMVAAKSEMKRIDRVKMASSIQWTGRTSYGAHYPLMRTTPGSLIINAIHL